MAIIQSDSQERMTNWLRQRVVTQLFLICCALTMTSCTVEQEKTIVGKYVAATPCANVVLTLRSDHSFVQEEQSNTAFMKRSGRWTLRNQWVVFKADADSANDKSFSVPIPGASRVERLPRGLTMGPEIINCPDSAHEFDYVNPWFDK